MKEIKVTDIIIYPIKGRSNKSLKGFARITLNEQLIIGGIRLLKGKKGLFLQFPQNFQGKDDVYPITVRLKEHITEKVTNAYMKES